MELVGGHGLDRGGCRGGDQMGIRILQNVRDYAPVSGSALLVLMCLADRANDDGGGAWPSVATMAREARCSERTVFRVLKHLTRLGLIERQGETVHGVAIYAVLCGAENKPDRAKCGGDTLSGGGDILAGEGVTSCQEGGDTGDRGGGDMVSSPYNKDLTVHSLTTHEQGEGAQAREPATSSDDRWFATDSSLAARMAQAARQWPRFRHVENEDFDEAAFRRLANVLISSGLDDDSVMVELEVLGASSQALRFNDLPPAGVFWRWFGRRLKWGKEKGSDTGSRSAEDLVAEIEAEAQRAMAGGGA